MSSIGSGTKNTITDGSTYSCIAGGQGNVIVNAEYATNLGGQRNVIYSRAGTILGGFENLVTGRYASVLGGSRNTAKARHSAVMGYQAITSGQVSLVMGFGGHHGDLDKTNNDAFCALEAQYDNSVLICADQILLNDLDVGELITPFRRLKSSVNRVQETLDQLSDIQERFEQLRDELNQKLADQTELLNQQLSLLAAAA